MVKKATSYVSNKTNTKVSVDKFFLTFGGNLYLEGLYLEDKAGDTLLYSRKLEVGVAITPWIQSGAIEITKLEWEGLKATISRSELSEEFNFDFLIEAFVSQDGEVTIKDESPVQADTTALSITLSPVSLKDFDLRYRDEALGIDASLRLGALEIAIPLFNLGQSQFRISDFSLHNSQISYIQTKPFEPSEEDSVEGILPFLILDHVLLDEVTASYFNRVDQQRAELKIGNFILQAPKIDLQNQIVELSTISLLDSKILFHDFGVDEEVQELAAESIPFVWPDWNVQVGSISLQNNSVDLKTADLQTQQGYFNPEVLFIENIRFSGEDLFLENNLAGLKVRDAGFVEAGGFELKNLRFDFSLSESSSQLQDLWIETNKSQVKGLAELGFQSIQLLMDNPETADFDISLTETRLDLKDSYFLVPELADDTLLRELATAPIYAQLKANGNLNSLAIDLLDLKWRESVFRGNGQLTHVLDPERLTFDFPQLGLRTDRETLFRFMDESQFANFNLPQEINLSANAAGKLDDVLAKVELDTELGNILLNGSFQNNEILAFDADLGINQLQLGAILGNAGLDTLSFQLSAKGSGTTLNDLSAQLSSSFDRLRINGNDYSGLALEGQLENGVGDVHMWLEDEFLNFDLLTNLSLDTARSIIDLNLDLKGIDLYKLGFAGQTTRAKMLFQAKFEGNPSDFDLTTSLSDAIVLYDQRTYPLGPLDLNARIREDSTSISIKSLLLNGFLRSNTSPDSLITAVTQHFKQHLDELDTMGQSLGGITMEMDLLINQAPILNQVLLLGLDQLDSARIQVDFSQPADKLLARIDFPYVKYGGTEVDSLGIRIDSSNDDLDLAFGFLALNSGPLAMDRTYFTGILQQSRLYFDFNSFSGEEKSVHIATDIGYSGDTLSIHVSPENLLVNSQEWSIPENNLIQIAQKFVDFEEFRFFSDQQELSLRNDLVDITDEHLAIQFDNFRLETFTSLLNPHELIASGFVNGRLVLENPFGAPGILGQLQVDSLNLLQVPLGNLNLEATSETLGDYILA